MINFAELAVTELLNPREMLYSFNRLAPPSFK